MFAKAGGSFSRGIDEWMLPFTVEHDWLWVYSMPQRAFLKKDEGGYGSGATARCTMPACSTTPTHSR